MTHHRRWATCVVHAAQELVWRTIAPSRVDAQSSNFTIVFFPTRFRVTHHRRWVTCVVHAAQEVVWRTVAPIRVVSPNLHVTIGFPQPVFG